MATTITPRLRSLLNKNSIQTSSINLRIIRKYNIFSATSTAATNIIHKFKLSMAAHPFGDNDPRNELRKTFLNNVMTANKKWALEYELNRTTNSDNTQKPLATVLSCCDSRAPTSALGGGGPNELFSVRNIGNQFSNSIGSFRYGIEQLNTPYAIIMGHTNCGAIRAAASDYRYLHTMVQQEVISLVRVIRFADSLTNSGKLDDMPFDLRCNAYSEINVDYQIMRLLDDWQINEKIVDGKLNIIGMMFDVHNIYNQGFGRLHIININGDKNKDSLKQHPLLQTLQDVTIDSTGQSIYQHGVNDMVSRLFPYSTNRSSTMSHF